MSNDQHKSKTRRGFAKSLSEGLCLGCLSIFALFFSSLICAQDLSAQPQPTDAEKTEPLQVLRVGVENRSYWPRYGITDEGHFSGYAQELLDAFAKDSGYQFKYVILTPDQLMAQMLSGELDLRYPDSPSWAHTDKKGRSFTYSRALDFSVVGVNVPPARVGRHQLDTMGMLQGFKPKEFKQAIDEGSLIVYPTASIADLVTLGGEDWVDGIYADPYVVQYHLREQGFSEQALAFDYTQPHTLHNYMLSTLLEPELMMQFDRWFQRNNRRILMLRKKYAIYDF